MEELNKDSHTFKHRPYYYHQKLRMGTLIAITPVSICDPQMAIAAIRAGEIGILDLGYRNSKVTIHRALSLLARFAGNNERWGIRWDTLGEKSRSLSKLADIIGGPIPVLILGGVKLQGKNAAEELKKSRHLAHKVLVEVNSLKAARAAQKTGYDGVIIKGHEAGGYVGNESSFILLQHLYKKLDIPYWIQGGIGLHTTSAVLAAATGVVLCEQLWLTEESPFSLRERNIWERIDGGETICIGQGDKWFRCFSRSGRAKLRSLELSLAKGSSWLTKLNSYLLITDDDPLIPIGQDIAFAARLAKRFGTVGRILTAIRRAMVDDLRRAKQNQAFAPNSPLAKAHNTLYPIVQGPMTRVSDVTPFCEAVATNGGLPFLGIGLMRAGELRILLTETKTKIGDLPWGVGILGFLPPELRKEQIKVICEISPPFAIISGGYPNQAAELEARGITTYLHVPSPGLLEMFIKDGARKFIFEGRECGGHVGPLTSFILWELAIQKLLEANIDESEKVQILFAGGIHNALSAAMVATLAAPLTSQGMKIGLLMGTAYLFTGEAVATGAINPEYQAQTIACRRTMLLESAPGYATRCAKTSFADEFNLKKGELFRAGEKSDEIRMELEFLSVGRLRIAAKGITRSPQATDKCDKFVKVDRETQRRQGLFLMGQVASLRDTTLSIADLHTMVSKGSKKYLSTLSVPPIEKEAKIIEKEDIAIVGMACMFPEASNLKEYWQNIINRVDTIREVNEERWRPADYFDPDPQAPDKTYSKWGGFLKEIRFNPIKYGIPPISVPYIETMQLLALEVAWQALEDAGYNQREFPRESTSVIFGVSQLHDLGIDYVFRTMLMHYLSKVEDVPVETRQKIIDSLYSQLPKWTGDSFPGFLGNIVAGRVANRLNLGSSNFTVDAACASSLAAVDIAIKQLQMRDCDVALVGGVDGTTHAFAYLAFSKTYALSPRGRARPFDDSADGTVISEGAAALVLKRLDDAERDGDHIYAIIKGIGTSSDGRNRSLIAPAPEGEVSALRRAYKNAGVSLSTVELIEAHGTGTAIGDKVEIESLNKVFENNDSLPQHCAIGSIKSMIGHCKAAAGMAGLIKTALSLKHEILPPTIGVEVPNSLVDFSQTPFYINTESRCWFATTHPRRAGVSAFGFGGSNFHLVLEEYTKDYRESHHLDILPREAEIFSWVRTSRAEIQDIIKQLSRELEKTEITDLSQLAYSVFLDEKGVRRKESKRDVRLDIVATSTADLKEKLRIVLNEIPVKGSVSKSHQGVYYSEDSLRLPGSVCFLFPGQGSQSINMLRDLVLSTPKTHSIFELADELLKGCFKQPLSRYIYPLPVFSDSDRRKQQLELNKTYIAQPALAVVDLVAYDLLKTYGIKAEFMVGHSFGEYVALCAAGALSQQNLISLSAIRGKLVQEVDKTNPGTMAAVQADAEKTAAALKESNISATLANLNAPDQTIIAGPIAVIDKAVKALNAKGLLTRKIPVTSAFHTTAMSEVGKKLTVELAKINFHKPQCKVYSNTTAGPYPDSPGDIRALLARHITRPVQFEKQIRQMYEAGARIFIEVGPGRVLTGLVERILNTEPHIALSLDVKGRSGWRQLAHLLAQTRNLGLPVNLKPWFENRQLDTISTDEVFKKAQAYASPSATAWRIYDGKVSPWHQAGPSKPVESSVGHVTGSVQSKKLPNAKEIVMLKQPQKVPKPILNKSLQSLGDTGTDPVVTQFQVIMTEFLKLQQEQQKITERLMAIQEQIMNTYLDGRTTTSKRAAKHSVLLGGVPPAPVLPKLPSAHPSINNVASVSSSPSETVLSETAAVQPSIPKTVTPVNDSPVLKEIPTTEEFQESLLRVTSERTGYPLEMLGIDLDLEGDLGLDSIKLVEIISALRNYHNLLQQDEEGIIDVFTGLKTLRSIVDWYDKNRLEMVAEHAPLSKQNTTSVPVISQPTSAGKVDNLFVEPLQRFTLKSVPVPLSESSKKRVFPKNHIILFIGEAPQLSLAIYKKLATENYRIRQIIPGKKTRSLKNNRFEVNLSSLESIQELRTLITQSGGIVGGIFNFMGVAEAASNNKCDDNGLDNAKHLFLVIKVFEADLKGSARRGGGLLVNFSGMDGQFGLQGKRSFPVGQAGCIGLLKTVAREWPEIRVKCIDVDLSTDSQILSAKIYQELTTLDSIIEVGLNQKGRWKIDLQKNTPRREGLSSLPINSQSIILVTGGSRGITAEVTKVLAAKYQPHLVIVGRTPFPEEESSQTRNLQSPQLLKEYLIQKLRQGKPNITPVVIEQHLQDILKQRQIRSNLAAMKEAGAQVEYYALDVRNQKLFAKLLDDIYASWGKIDGVIHGVGITEDKLIKDKTPESFSRVFATKVTSARILAEKLRPETLKFLVFFSSVAGRFGSIGQSGYSAANEILNKLAVCLDHQWPGRVVSINWGPWDAGLVNDELRKLYAYKDIKLIPLSEGVKFFMQELHYNTISVPEVLITRSLKQIVQSSLRSSVV